MCVSVHVHISWPNQSKYLILFIHKPFNAFLSFDEVKNIREANVRYNVIKPVRKKS